MPALFSIQCDTCQTRLKVRNKSAIGQILACPKCGSMVQIEPPEGWVEADESSDSAIGDSQSESGASSKSNSSGAAKDSKRTGAGANRQGAKRQGAKRQGAERQGGKSSGSKKSAANAAQETEAEKSLEGGPLLPGEDWTSGHAKARRKMLLLYGGSGIGLVVAVVLVGVLVYQMTRPAKQVVKDLSEMQKAIDEDKAKSDKTNLDSDNLDPTNNKDTDSVDPNNKDPNKDDTSSDNKKTDPETGDPKTGDPKSTDPLNNKKTEPGENSKTDTKLPENPSVAIDTTDPIGLTPKAAPEDPEPEIDDKTFGELSELNDLLNGSAFDEVMPDTSLAGEYAKDTPYISKPIDRPIDYIRLTKMKIPEIKFDDLRLVDVVIMLERLSNVTVTIDADSMMYSGLSLKQRISLAEKDLTIAQIAERIANKIGLEVSTAKSGFVFSVAKFDEFTKRSFDVADLTKGEQEESNRLANLITNFVIGESNDAEMLLEEETTQLVPKEKTISIENTARKIWHTSRLLDQIRLARGLPAANKDSKVVKLGGRVAGAAEKLNKVAGFDFVLDTRLTEVLAKTQRLKLDLLIDWESLNEIGWNYNSKLAVHDLGTQPFVESMVPVLSAMNLELMVLREDLIEVTTAQKSLARIQTEIYDCKDFIKTEEEARNFLGRVEQLTRRDLQNNPNSAFYFDIKGGNYLIAKFSDASHQVLRDYIERVRTELKKRLDD